MFFYISIFFITMLLSSVELFNIKRKYKKYIIILLSIIYIIISGFRWNGVDWMVYYPFFNENYSLNDFWSSNVDKGFGLINFIIKNFTDNYSILLLILAIVIITIKVNFIIKFSMLPLFSVLYWYGSDLGDIFFIRQTLAVAITLIACRFIIKKRLIFFLLFCFIAMTVQISTISFILAYFIFHKKIKIKFMIIGIVISFIIGKFIDNSLLINLTSLAFIDTDRLFNKAEAYVYIHDYTRENSVMLLGYIRRILFLPLEIWALSKMEKINSNYRGFLNLIIFGYIVYFLFGNMGQVFAARFSSAYTIYEIITIPSIFILIKSWKKRLLLFLVLSGYLLFRYIFFINLNYEDFIPYVNVIFS